jgi:hypothetical protein
MAMGALIVATIVAGLWIDQSFAAGQLVVNVAAWLVLALLWRRSAREDRPALALCLAYATAGEMFLSLAWGLYDYRLGNIPLFVPPGHVLLFWLGMRIAARLPERSEWLVPLVSLPVVAFLAYTGRDTLGPLLFAMFVACMAIERGRRLYATMFALSLVMEVYGTWLGNWTWRAEVPWLGLATTNPPLAAGAFYCALDLLVINTRGLFAPGKPRVEGEGRLDPRGHLQGALVVAPAADDLEPQGQPLRAES